MGGVLQDFGYLDPLRLQAPHQLSGVQGGHVCPTALGSSASEPPGYDRHGQFDSSFIYQQAGRDSLPHLAMLDCRPFPLVGVSEHKSPGKTHSRLSERDSRPPISSESANTDRVVHPPRDRGTYLLGMGIATKKCIAIYCDKQGRIAIRITIYCDSVTSKI